MDKLYIFLDIDGVLNCTNDWSEENFPLHLGCVKNLADTVNFFRQKYEVHIILSSSWRTGFDLEKGHAVEVAELLKTLEKFGMTVEDKTPFFLEKTRADEVNFYITENHLENFRCIAIDDTRHLFGDKLLKNVELHIVNSRVGFSRKDFLMLTGKGIGKFYRLWNFFKTCINKL